ncbi:MAG: aminotransferase [Phycisphaerae bacterium]|nr:aminotransferase [Phycisphaerae bacterium]
MEHDPAQVRHVASRLRPFGSSIFATMSRLALEHDAINLGQGFPDFHGPSFIKAAAIEAIESGHDQYAPSNGVPVLAESIARHAQERLGRSIDPGRHVTVTSGCTEAIAASLLGLLDPGDEVIVIEPYYDSYVAVAAMAHATCRYVTLESPGFELPATQLAEAFNDRTRVIIVNTPHNPTGRVFSPEELQVIADLCIKWDVIALCDEVYEHLVYDREHVSLGSLPGMEDRAIVMSSLGKSFSLTGWKIGWAIASEGLTGAVRSGHQYLTFATATPLQHAAAVALDAPEAYFTEFISEYRQRRDLLLDGLRSVGLVAEPPEGSYFILADHRPLGMPDDVAFCTHLITQCGIVAIPPSVFYSDPSRGSHLVRFSFCKKIQTLQAAIERLHRLQAV